MRRLRSPAAALAAAVSMLVPTGAVALVTTATVVRTAAPAAALPNGLALTPPMGFNNWNTTHCRPVFNEAMVKGIADIFVSRGLKDAGYQYVNLDDCWARPQRNAQGNLVPDPVRFPNGIKAVADYVHSKGLKFGIYTSAGTKTCNVAGFPGGLGREQQDANLFASWGVDYLKYDNCNNTGAPAQPRYEKMRDALRNTGRPIVYSICEWGQNRPWLWARDVGNLWRTTGDINSNWSKIVEILKKNEVLAQYAGPGHWNDPDMLEVGNGRLTLNENRSHFSLWAIMAAPLLIGTDLRQASQQTFDVLSNRDVIAVDQDPLGKQGVLVRRTNGLAVYSKPLANGDRAVALFNETGSTATISTTAAEVGIGGASSYTLRDLWTKESRTSTGAISASVASHATVIYRVSRAGAPPTPPSGTTALSDLTATSSTNGWGPVEKDRSVNTRAAGDGRTLTIQGTTFAKGLGAHAVSDVTYHLGGKCSQLVVDVGIDDEVGDRGTVVFQIFRDATKVADSGATTGTTPAKRLTADLTGGTTLRLAVTNGGDDINYDHADWGNPQLTCA
jgi:alpha-galactosidase